jgi:hypothetical protein
MKRIIQWFVTPFWRASTPVRRALMGRFDARVVRIVSMTIEDRMLAPILETLSETEARLKRIEELLIRADRSASTLAEEVDLVLNGLTREIFRLQAQVESLRKGDEEVVVGLTLLAEPDDAEPSSRSEVAPIERSRVG